MNTKPLNIKNFLSLAPLKKPKYSQVVKDTKGNDIECGCPNMTRALVALMDLAAVNGGAASHWGGPAAMSECMSALHAIMFKEEKWFDHYNFVNDIGHGENGIYALRANLGFGELDFDMLKGFRSIISKLTGHGESHLYPEGVLLSNGPLGSALPQAQGLSHGDKLLGNNRVTIVSMSDGASMEGEAKESFAAIPGLRSKGHLNPFILIVSDNNTKLSGRISEDSYTMNPTFNSMSSLGWNVIEVENGNDLQTCYHAIENALSVASENKPVMIWLKTTKGYGVKSTMESKSGGHGFPIKPYSNDIHDFISEILSNDVPAELKKWSEELTIRPTESSSASTPSEKSQAGLVRGAIKAREEGRPVLSVSCDLQGSTGMGPFHAKFPNDSIDIGIAESNMISHAAGLSKLGFIPIVDTFAAFGVTKGNLPLIMASLSSCPMIAVFSHTGFQDAADGASHQSLTYLSAVSSIPNLKAHIVSTSAEAEELMYQAINEISEKRENGEEASTHVFFVGRENYPKTLNEKFQYKLGKAQIIREGKDGLIVSAGPTLFEAISAASDLSKKGIEVSVINMPCVNDPDIDTISKVLKKSNNRLVTVEDHQLIGGLGQQLIHKLKTCGNEFKVTSLGVKGHFGRSAYSATELYRLAGIDHEAITRLFI